MLLTLRSNHKLAVLVAVSLASMFAAIVLVGIAFTEHTIAQNDRLDAQRIATHQTCVAIQNLNTVITQTLRRSLTNLPKLTYYQHHPSELALQRSSIRRELRVFRPRTCK